MVMKFINLFFTSIRLEKSIDYARFSADPGYPQILIRELCGEQDAGPIGSLDSRGDKISEATRRAA